MTRVHERQIAVVVPTHNRADRLPQLVSALEAQTLEGDHWEVVIVDDASTDDTAHVLAEIIQRSPLSIRASQLPSNFGPAAARNEGWRATRAPFVAFTDDDCAPAPGWLAAGLAALAAASRTGIVQGRTLPKTAPTVRSATRRVEGPTPFFEGCNLFVRRAALEATGGFDEELGFGGEDTSLGWAVLEAGWQRSFADDALVYHDVTDGGLRWHVRQGALQGRLVRVARKRPSMRAALWRPWCVRPRHLAWWSAVAGAGMARRRPLLAISMLIPYAWIRRPTRWNLHGLRVTMEYAVVDGAACVALAMESARQRSLLL